MDSNISLQINLLGDKPFHCDIHGTFDIALVINKGIKEDIFCIECLRLKLRELGLKPMEKRVKCTNSKRSFN